MTNFPRDTGLRQLIEDLQRRLYTLERRVADNVPSLDYGSVVVDLVAANSATAAVVFAQTFITAPRVYVSIETGSDNLLPQATGAVTAAGFTVQVVHRDVGATATASPTVHWIALGD